MPTVNLPRGDWETVLYCLDHSTRQDWLAPIIKEIEDQVYSQEY